MDGPTLLLIHNTGYIIDSALMVGLLVLIFFKSRHELGGQLFLCCFFFVLVFVVSHVIGVNIHDPYLSRDVLMANLSVIFIPVFLAHFVSIFTGKFERQKKVIVLIYVVSFALLAFYIVSPDSFLLPSQPKLYFPDYYVAGDTQWFMRLFSEILVPIYMVVQLVTAYRSADFNFRNRIKYLALSISLGFAFGFLAVPLVFTPDPTFFGWVVDPVWSVLFVPLFALPFTYAVIKYELVDIRIVAKQALGYFILVEVVGVVVSLLITFDDYIRQSFPSLPLWVLPIIFSLILVSIGAAVWRRLSETDVLKYEFMTVVTHKFRTPLTRIHWATEDIVSAVPEEKKASVDAIIESERQLLALTDILVHLSEADATQFDYHPSPIVLAALFGELESQYAPRAMRRSVALSFQAEPGLAVLADREKSDFVFQIFLDNALSYTPAGGSIVVRAYRDTDRKHGVIEFSDTGIGMSPETASRIFKRFYRGDNARHADTEGMGIGLFMAKKIAENQGGRISVRSDGEGKGSTFSVRLPLAKSSLSDEAGI